MSHPPPSRVLPVLQPVAERNELHQRLLDRLERSRPTAGAELDWGDLLRQISQDYEDMDVERRGIVRSMQMIAEETSARSGTGNNEALHLQAILDHINDVVITVAGNGSIQVFNPTGERVFGYSESEIMGQPISKLLPDLPLHGSMQQGLQALALSARNARNRCRRAARTTGRFPPSWSRTACCCTGARRSSSVCATAASGCRPSRRCATARRATARWSRARPRSSS
jgi:PAS domain S-box-containing protein